MIYEYHVPIPYEYLEIADQSPNKKQTFAKYVRGYIKSQYPEFEFVRIEKMNAICRKKS
ncbi:hypothetical protein JOD17_003141 [Geomicrobium sediminis]|uniref:Uncharacterized protein n=1 Tax=Geomicrobium sediminis TaxID=1347788 RepID=A0ABS2PGD2_9BACL|nr:hypothetical protein [Geomicrobium sediminis]